MKIIWSEEAETDYHDNIDYLLSNWSPKVAVDFIEEVETLLEHLKNYPQSYPLTNYKGIRQAVVRKQVTLYYQQQGNTIYLVRMWIVHKDPDKLKL